MSILATKIGVDTAENEPPKVHERPFKILLKTRQDDGTKVTKDPPEQRRTGSYGELAAACLQS
jgi:hypothetical protein